MNPLSASAVCRRMKHEKEIKKESTINHVVDGLVREGGVLKISNHPFNPLDLRAPYETNYLPEKILATYYEIEDVLPELERLGYKVTKRIINLNIEKSTYRLSPYLFKKIKITHKLLGLFPYTTTKLEIKDMYKTYTEIEISACCGECND